MFFSLHLLNQLILDGIKFDFPIVDSISHEFLNYSGTFPLDLKLITVLKYFAIQIEIPFKFLLPSNQRQMQHVKLVNEWIDATNNIEAEWICH